MNSWDEGSLEGTFTVPWRTQVGIASNEASAQAERERFREGSGSGGMLETRRDSYSSLQYPESPGFRGRIGQGAKDEGGTKRSKKGRKATT